MFSVALTRIYPRRYAWGQITIGEFSERFQADLTYWSPDQYYVHWHDAAERLISGKQRSSFITSITEPKSTNFFVWWPAWRMGRRILMQNHLFFMNTLRGPFHEDNVFLHVGAHYNSKKKDNHVSEWVTGIQEMKRIKRELEQERPTRRCSRRSDLSRPVRSTVRAISSRG